MTHPRTSLIISYYANISESKQNMGVSGRVRNELTIDIDNTYQVLENHSYMQTELLVVCC